MKGARVDISENDQRWTPAAGGVRLLVSLCAAIALGALVSAPGAPAAKTKKWEIAITADSETHIQFTGVDCPGGYQTRNEDEVVDSTTPRQRPLVVTGQAGVIGGDTGGLEGEIEASVTEDRCGPPEGEFAPPPQNDCGRRSAKGQVGLAYAEKGDRIVIDGREFKAPGDGLAFSGGVSPTQPFRACHVSIPHSYGEHFLKTGNLNKIGEHERKLVKGKYEKSCKDEASATVTSCTYKWRIEVEVTRVK